MGLLDKIKNAGINQLKGQLREQLEDSIENKLGIDIDGDRKIGKSDSSASASAAQPSANVGTQSAAVQNAAVTDWDAYFKQILEAEFSSYTIEQDVSAAKAGFAAASPCLNYSFRLSRAGQTACVIMLTPHNRDRNAAYKNAKAAAGKKFVNFYTHMNNERAYVIQRIKKFI